MTAHELRVKKYLEEHGWKVWHKGWPDFLCLKVNRNNTISLMTVEAKRQTDCLTSEQKQVHQLLIRFGLPVYVFRPHDVIGRRNNIAGRSFLTNRELSEINCQIAMLRNEIETLRTRTSDVETLISESSSLTEDVLRNLYDTPILDEIDGEEKNWQRQREAVEAVGKIYGQKLNNEILDLRED